MHLTLILLQWVLLQMVICLNKHGCSLLGYWGLSDKLQYWWCPKYHKISWRK